LARIEKALPKERAFGIRCNSEEKDLSAAACDGGDYQHLVPILEAVFLIAEEADIFFVDIEVDEAANLAVLAAEVLAESRESALDIGNKLG
jgi:hypothetical protein